MSSSDIRRDLAKAGISDRAADYLLRRSNGAASSQALSMLARTTGAGFVAVLAVLGGLFVEFNGLSDDVTELKVQTAQMQAPIERLQVLAEANRGDIVELKEQNARILTLLEKTGFPPVSSTRLARRLPVTDFRRREADGLRHPVRHPRRLRGRMAWRQTLLLEKMDRTSMFTSAV